MKSKNKAARFPWLCHIIVISCQVLTSLVCCQKNTDDQCKVYGIFNDVTISAGMKAGLYIPYDNPSDLAQMTATKCTGEVQIAKTLFTQD